jgi:hypothetical protein
VKSIASGNEIAFNRVLTAILAIANGWSLGIYSIESERLGLEFDRTAAASQTAIKSFTTSCWP